MTKKLLIGLAAVLLLVGLGIGGYLVLQQQELRREASVVVGVAEVFLTPQTKTVNVGETFPVQVQFTNGGQVISGVTIQLDYTYTGDSPPVSVTEIQQNSTLLGSGNWSYPIKTIKEENGAGRVRIAAVNVGVQGYSATTQTTVATLLMRANVTGTVTMRFDSTQSKITSKTTAADVLLIPSSSGSYTVIQPNSTPTPTNNPVTSTLTPTPTPTTTTTTAVVGATATPTLTGVAVATPTGGELPVAGSVETTVLIGGMGVMTVLLGLGLLWL